MRIPKKFHLRATQDIERFPFSTPFMLNFLLYLDYVIILLLCFLSEMSTLYIVFTVIMLC
jgi:hypothetical protein